MKIRQTISLLLFSSLLLSNQNVFARCVTGSTASLTDGSMQVNAVTSFQQPGVFPEMQGIQPGVIWGNNLGLPYMGDRLNSDIGIHEGSDIVARGPVKGGILLWTPPEVRTAGSMTLIQSSMNVSINWSPDGREVCTNHKTVPGKGRKCVQKGIELLPTSFVVDIVSNGGATVHFAAQFNNVNQVRNATIRMPILQCDGAIDRYEARIRSLAGGQVEFKVHQANYNLFWND